MRLWKTQLNDISMYNLIRHAEGRSPEASHRSFGCLKDTLRMTEKIIPDTLRMTEKIIPDTLRMTNGININHFCKALTI